MSVESISIRASKPSDAAAIAAMIRELAEHEGVTDALSFSVEQLQRALEGTPPRLRAVIAEDSALPGPFQKPRSTCPFR